MALMHRYALCTMCYLCTVHYHVMMLINTIFMMIDVLRCYCVAQCPFVRTVITGRHAI